MDIGAKKQQGMDIGIDIYTLFFHGKFQWSCPQKTSVPTIRDPGTVLSGFSTILDRFQINQSQVGAVWNVKIFALRKAKTSARWISPVGHIFGGIRVIFPEPEQKYKPIPTKIGKYSLNWVS